jgi:hypothetical protein
VRERWVLDDVMDCEKHSFADLAAYAIAICLDKEVVSETFWGDVCRIVDGVEALARRGDGIVVDVRGEDLYLGWVEAVRCALR